MVGALLPTGEYMKEYIVYDSGGLWGSIRASSEEEARKGLQDELEPNGSLLPDFTLKEKESNEEAANHSR